MLIVVLISIDYSQAFALSFVIDKNSLGNALYANLEETQGQENKADWLDRATIVFDGDFSNWHLAPYPVHVDGALYYGLIYEDQSILISQIQVNAPIPSPMDNLPIPESPTLVLLGLGLLGVGAFFRGEATKKMRKVS